MKQKVVVLGGNYASLLGMIRATGLAGCDVTVIKTYVTKKEKTIELNSKFVSRYFLVKDADREGLVNLLLNKCVDNSQKVILFPINDDTTMTIDLFIDKLKDYFICPSINNMPGAITDLMNKSRQKELARLVGLKTPKSELVTLINGSYEITDKIIFPCFTKAEISVYGGKTFMKKCCNELELKTVLDQAAKKWNCNVLIEEFVNIEKEYAVVGCCFNHNVFIPGVIYLKQQGSGNHKGVAMLGDIEPVEEYGEVIKLIKEFIIKIDYEGMFDVDFYYSDGRYYFNELNLRCGASCFAFTYNGINIPKLLIDYYTSNILTFIEVENKYSFVNEKVCLESYTSNYISWKDYKKNVNTKGIHAINYNFDLAPWNAFQKMIINERLKKIVKYILHALGLYSFK